MTQPEEEDLVVQPRRKMTVSLEIPQDVLDSLGRNAAGREMTAEALMKLYIGQGLRQDLAKQASHGLMPSQHCKEDTDRPASHER